MSREELGQDFACLVIVYAATMKDAVPEVLLGRLFGFTRCPSSLSSCSNRSRDGPDKKF